MHHCIISIELIPSVWRQYLHCILPTNIQNLPICLWFLLFILPVFRGYWSVGRSSWQNKRANPHSTNYVGRTWLKPVTLCISQALSVSSNQISSQAHSNLRQVSKCACVKKTVRCSQCCHISFGTTSYKVNFHPSFISFTSIISFICIFIN